MHGPSQKRFWGAGWLGLLVVLTLLTTPAQAVNKYWATTGNAWSAAANWNPAGAPVTGDNVFLTFNDANNRSIYYYMPTVPATFNSFTLDQTGTGTLSFFQGYNSYTFLFAAHVEVIGRDGKALYQHSLGSNTVAGSFFMAYNAGSSATYQLSNTASLSAANEYVGDFGTGLFQQSGGSNTASNVLYIGYGPPSTGTYQLGGAGVLNADTLLVGHLGTGTFTQTGGIATSSVLRVGGASGKTGTYTMQGGSLQANEISVGYKGQGSFKHYSGMVFGLADSSLKVGEQAGSVGKYELGDPAILGASLSFTNCFVGYEGAGSFTQQAGDHFVSADLVLAFRPGSSGAYTLKGGTLTTGGGIYVQQNGTFTQEGGYIEQPFILMYNYGNFVHKGGTFNSRLANYGTATFQGSFTSNYEMYNEGQIFLPAGGTINKTSEPMYNNSHMTMTGGEVTGLAGLVNNGFIQGHGTIGGFINNGSVVQDGGDLKLRGAFDIANYGTLELQASRLVRLESTLVNYGTVTLNGAMVNGSIFNNKGVIEGPGVINSDFNNESVILVSRGTTKINQEFSNSGQIVLNDAKATLGGGQLTNLSMGTIRGFGTVLQHVDNNGAIEAVGGALILSSLAAGPASNISAETGASLILNNSGFHNYGVINLRGGTIKAGQYFSNDNLISGFGTLSSLETYNHGRAAFASGVSIVNGTFTNYEGFHVTADHCQVIFTGFVVNQENGYFKNTGGVFTFAGGYSNSGTFYSDPATQTFTDLMVGATGVLLGATGDYFLIGNDFLNRSGKNLQWNTLRAELEFINGSDNRHLMLLPGADRGAVKLGFKDNFAWGVLDISRQFLELQDGNDILGGAFYVGELLGADLRGDLVANILGHGLNIYYDPLRPGNEYLLGQRYAFLDGGFLAPVGYTATPLPGSLILVLSGLLGLTGMGLRARGRQH